MAFKPVVFVPGIPGSTLIDVGEGERLFFRPRRLDDSRWKKRFLAGLHGPDDPEAPDGVEAEQVIASLFDADAPLLDIGAGKQASSLWDLLRRFGYRPEQWHGVAWDWRRPVDARATRGAIRDAVLHLADREGRPVALLSHGAGGLAARAALEEEPGLLGTVSDLVAFGVPWAGSLEPLYVLTGQTAYGPLHRKEVAAVFGLGWAVYDLLPPVVDGDGPGPPPLFLVDGEPASPLAAVGWIGSGKGKARERKRAARALEAWRKRGPGLDLGGVRVWNLVGWGLPTLVGARLESNEVAFDERQPEGDGVVPLCSAAWLSGPRARTFYLPLGGFTPARHHVLWTARPARPLLREILTSEEPWIEHVHAVPDHQDATSDPAVVRVRVVAQDAEGKPLPDVHARLPEHADEEAVAAGPDGRLVLRVHRHRWRWTRSDVRQVRVVVTWRDGEREPRRDLRVLAGRES